MPIDEAAFEKRMKERGGRRIFGWMILLQVEHKKRLSVANPPPKFLFPAPRGQFPHFRTLNLRDCVAVEPSSLASVVQSLSGRTGILTNAEYGAILKSKGWKGIEDTHAELKAAGAYK